MGADEVLLQRLIGKRTFLRRLCQHACLEG